MNLEVGMYVRFKDKRGSHYIRKITSVNTEYPGKLYAGIYIDKTANNCNGVSLKNIINASHNIIDLIDKGDYVNGYPVVDFDLIYFNGVDRLEEPKRVSIIVDRNSNMGFSETYFKNKDIKSIVTKEQFNSMKYEVGE